MLLPTVLKDVLLMIEEDHLVTHAKHGFSRLVMVPFPPFYMNGTLPLVAVIQLACRDRHYEPPLLKRLDDDAKQCLIAYVRRHVFGKDTSV